MAQSNRNSVTFLFGDVPDEDARRLSLVFDDWQNWAAPSSQESAPRIVRPLLGGLSNKSYLVKQSQCFYCVRLNACHAYRFGVDRSREHHILNLLLGHNIAPQLYFWNRDADAFILEYIEGEAATEEDLNDASFCHTLHDLIHAYQQIDIPRPKFNYHQHLDAYWKQIEHTSAVTDQRKRDWQHFFSRWKAFESQRQNFTLTHHDLNPGNIIKTVSGLKIIDWEYAALGLSDYDTLYIDHLRKCQKPELNHLNEKSIQETSIYTELFYWLDHIWHELNAQT